MSLQSKEMAAENRKRAILKALKEEYGITCAEELLDAIRNMTPLDITQFVFRPD